MASRKKQEDKHLQILKDLVALPYNKKCFDCGQRGPTYVNMTVGAFVCTSCSGLLRGLNPPHRIKSISMASFSPQEIEFLQQHGNDVCSDTWLALWDAPAVAEPESKEESKVKEFLTKKYERKTWHSNRPRIKVPQEPEAKPLKTLLGENTPQVIVHSQHDQKSQISNSSQVSSAGLNNAPVPKSAQPTATHQEIRSNMDLLGDLGTDPFGSTASSQNQDSAFGTFQQPPPAQNQRQQNFTAFGTSPSFANPGVTVNFQQSSEADFFGVPSMNNTKALTSNNFATSSAALNPPAADKYAALADLNLSTSTTHSVFSGSSIFGTSHSNNASISNNTPQNPFMSAGTQSNSVSVFQQQQQRTANPFQTHSMGSNQTFGSNPPQPLPAQNTAPQQNLGNIFGSSLQTQSNSWQQSSQNQGSAWSNHGVNFSVNSPFQNSNAFGSNAKPSASNNNSSQPFNGNQFPMKSNTQTNIFENSSYQQQLQQGGFGQPMQMFGNQAQSFNSIGTTQQMYGQPFNTQSQQQFGIQQHPPNFGASQPVSKPPFGGVHMPGFGQQASIQQQNFGSWSNTQQSVQHKSNNPFM